MVLHPATTRNKPHIGPCIDGWWQCTRPEGWIGWGMTPTIAFKAAREVEEHQTKEKERREHFIVEERIQQRRFLPVGSDFMTSLAASRDPDADEAALAAMPTAQHEALFRAIAPKAPRRTLRERLRGIFND